MSIDTPLVQAAIRSVSAACRITRSLQQDLARLQQITKDDRSPVTVADFAAQAVVAVELNRALGGAPGDVLIVGEEQADLLRRDELVREQVLAAVRTHDGDLDDDAILDAIDACRHDATAEAYWTLDPIDGTKGFLRGQQYAIALGYIERGQVTAAVMGCPALPRDHDALLDRPDPHGVMYAAATGAGAWELDPADLAAAPRRTCVADRGSDTAIRVCESFEKAHSSHDDTDRVIERLGRPGEPVRIDSQCKYALVARGQADAYLRLPTSKSYVEKVWDHAAGMLIAREAGGVVTDATGAPLDFSRGARLDGNRGIVCASSGLHEPIVRAIEELGIATARPV